MHQHASRLFSNLLDSADALLAALEHPLLRRFPIPLSDDDGQWSLTDEDPILDALEAPPFILDRSIESIFTQRWAPEVTERSQKTKKAT